MPTGARFSDNYFSQAYARLNRDGIANTITTHFSNPGSGRFIHYQDVRSITVREAARLQSFPDTFIFSGELGAQMRHVGNAVPPLMARAIRDQIGRDLLLARSNRPAERLSDHKPDPPVVVSKERSRIMRAVPSRNTSAEIALRKALWAAGLRGFRTQARAVPGNPDIVFARQKVAIFVDGCFWHGCPKCYREPSTNKAYWQMKVQRNKSRDEQVNKLCGQRGWRVIRIWEHAILSRPDAAAVRVARFLRGSKAVASRRHKKR